MKESITANLDKPAQLEMLYRNNKSAFRKSFNEMYAEIQGHPTAAIWHERLNYQNDEVSFGGVRELFLVAALALITGLLVRLPEFSRISEDFYYPRNISFIVFPVLCFYFAWKGRNSLRMNIITGVVILASVLFMNVLPDMDYSDTFVLACIHVPLVMWALTGMNYTGSRFRDFEPRLQYLRYNGDLLVMTAIILIAGAIMTGITIGLFSIIDIRIEDWYFRNIVIWGLAAAPLVATHLVQTNPSLVHKVSPAIAKIFTPLVLITLVAYFIAVTSSGKDPYNDREFLLLFNIVLIAVMSILFFSVAENSNSSTFGKILLLSLSSITVLLTSVALSAIIFRIISYGISPNRLAVAGANTLFLANLVLISIRLSAAIRGKTTTENVGKSIALFLPIYSGWAMAVTFIFPLVF
ncbi:hypothetical protein [Spirochaeta dissipatitropha]